ncbi:MAG: c-type cytochrome [Nitrospinota bacterium]
MARFRLLLPILLWLSVGAIWFYALVVEPERARWREAGGAALYSRHCLSCHGPSGRGEGERARFLPGGVPSLPERLKRQDEREVLRVIAQGRKLMPAFRPALSEEERRALLAYIRTFR